ncbi:MAG: acylphosphatase [Planctomycetes bacterium]|nr:acylphosphatase [Planctomycetota bacterium]
MIRRTVRYSGHVQGVGFRYTAARAAGNFSVTGYVKNLVDGRVELVAEGEPREVEAFVAEVARLMGDKIRKAASDDTAASGEFGDFCIQH